jgi:hypothetical protein
MKNFVSAILIAISLAFVPTAQADLSSFTEKQLSVLIERDDVQQNIKLFSAVGVGALEGLYMYGMATSLNTAIAAGTITGAATVSVPVMVVSGVIAGAVAGYGISSMFVDLYNDITFRDELNRRVNERVNGIKGKIEAERERIDQRIDQLRREGLDRLQKSNLI